MPVLSFLEGMYREGEEPDNTPPRSLADPDDYQGKAESVRSGGRTPQLYSPVPRSKASETLLNTGGMFSPRKDVKVNGLIQEVRDDDADSNVQEGMRSELGEMMAREPGPDDPPGVKYASYDSGPSFGNFGPLPTDDHVASNNPYAHSSWNNATALTAGGQMAYPAGLTSGQPLNGTASDVGATPRQTLANIDTDVAARAKSPERAVRSTRTQSRAQSRAGTNKGDTENLLLSPRSVRTKLTKVTEKGTVYPPLPESRMGDNDIYGDAPSASPTKSRARSKAASISPSDSPSQRVQVFASKPNGTRSPGPGSALSGGNAGHQSRPFSPYRHAPTHEDLLNAAVRGRALAIPQSPEKEPSNVSQSPSKSPSKLHSPQQSRALSLMEGGKTNSQLSVAKQPSQGGSRLSHASRVSERERTQPPRSPSPEGLDPEEARIVNEALAARTPRTSYYAASLKPDDTDHFHDVELCVLLHQESDPNQHDVVKKALRKAVRQRIKKLGMKYDHDSINKYRKSYHDHDPSVHLREDRDEYDEPPRWASDLKREIVLMQQRIESLGPKIENLKGADMSFGGGSRFQYAPDESTRTPMTQTVNIQTQPTGTMADSMYQQQPETEIMMDDEGHHEYDDEMTETQVRRQPTDGDTRSLARSVMESEQGRDDSPGHQHLEEELYKLRQRPLGSQSARSHQSWQVAHHNEEDDYEDNGDLLPSVMPTIPDMNGDETERASSPPLPDLPSEAIVNREMAVQPQGAWTNGELSPEGGQQLPPWQRIHSRLLSWAIIWPMSELENALNSTTRGQQVDEVALSIWSTQTYKRYVRAKLTDSPQGVVDRLFVPPNMADAISNAVFNGRHGDACGMLKDLWAPFGLDGMPRLIVVLAKHRSDPNHWVVHRFSLPDGALTTYDSYPERTLPDGRPLGWWFAIRVAWPNAMYPSPDHLVQKMVRLHRPLQLPIDNSVAAAGIWRNILMGSRAERSLDLERLRDLINTEVKNLKQRKQLGKLSIGSPRPPWEDMN
ncbi:hypothetical protein CPB83DRAFT_768808 [Crepidotus variabilis]|uniref:Uncharacterized protein n=1 Tax=Crepidotus variabilis TaxID=179855 RepID=A0A9P6EEM6_9AGAR|nr:hypothetical protein CPB83DRAFT_768808 [Crepidotus variabilis]